jgi:putative transposase
MLNERLKAALDSASQLPPEVQGKVAAQIEEVHARLRPIFDAPDETTARTLLTGFVANYQTTAPTAVATLERGFDDATAVLALPAAYRVRVRTTNGVERLNEEIRRRERVIRIFPNRESVIRLVGALLMEQDVVWMTGKRYFDMTAYWLWRETRLTQIPLFPAVSQKASMAQPA